MLAEENEEIVNEESVNEELPEADIGALSEEETPQDNPVEERAYKMGWVPKESFKGDPAKWRPADEFVERGEMLIPILNKKIRTLEQRQKDKDESFTKYLGDMRTKLHSQKLDEHESRKRQAVEEGDTDAYNRLSNDPPKNELPEYKAPEAPDDPVFDDWVVENDWYKSDYDKYQEAEQFGRYLRNTRPELVGRDYLDEVSKHVREKFSNPNRDKASTVEGGTQKAKVVSGKLFNTLENEAKAAFNAFVRDGIFKNTVNDREAYAKDVLG